MFKIFIFFIVLLLYVMPAAAFPIPERLEFQVSYAGIPAGKAVQEVKREGNEINIVSTARSAAWLNVFFPVDDRIESILVESSETSKIGLPRLFRENIKEGKTRHHKEMIFNRQKEEVLTRDFLKNNAVSVQKITPMTYDTLSSFYYYRTVPLQVGTSTFIDIFDGKRLWNTEVQVIKREEIETSLGRFKTVLIKPLLKHEGIFARTGEILIWLTDDDRRIPVLMKSKIKVGSITATLTGGSYWPEKK